MASIQTLVGASLLFMTTASAHFSMLEPVPLGGKNADTKKEGNWPCGDPVPSFSTNATNDFHVDGDLISLANLHSEGTWLIRGKVSDNSDSNWTQLFPTIYQEGIGSFCEPAITVPREWVGKTGLVGVAAKGADDFLYQCSYVNFKSGSNNSTQSCKNDTAVKLSFKDDPDLTAVLNAAPASAAPGLTPTLGSLVGAAAMVVAVMAVL